MNTMKVMIDTCVIIDALQSRKPFDSDAQAIIMACERDLFEGCISSSSITDIYYIMRHDGKDEQTVRDLISDLMDLMTVVATQEIDCRQAYRSPMPDFEDAVLVSTGLRIGADAVVTRNTRDYTASRIPVYKPKRFLHSIGVEGWK